MLLLTLAQASSIKARTEYYYQRSEMASAKGSSGGGGGKEHHHQKRKITGTQDTKLVGTAAAATGNLMRASDGVLVHNNR